MTLLATGATGNVGSAALALLHEANILARGAVPPVLSTDQIRLADTGTATVAFDSLDPSTWDGIFAGVESLFLRRPLALSNVPRDILPALEAAKRAGLEHSVFLSLQGAESNEVVPHATIEKWLRSSGLPWTILRPSFFYAKPFHNIGRAWTLTSPTANTYYEIAEILSKELGRTIRYMRPGLGRYAVHVRQDRAMPWAMDLVTAVIYTFARLGRASGLTDDVRTVTGRPPTSFADFAHRKRTIWLPRPAGRLLSVKDAVSPRGRDPVRSPAAFRRNMLPTPIRRKSS